MATKNKFERLPARKVLLDVVKGVVVPNNWEGVETTEVKEIEREANRLRAELLRDPRLIALDKKAAKLRTSKAAKNKAARKRKNDLYNRIRLAEVTPALVAEVRRFASIAK